MEIRKILCPVDFSPNSDLALKSSERIADRFGAALATLHVSDHSSTYFTNSFDLAFVSPQTDSRQIPAASMSSTNQKSVTHHRFGNPGKEICQFAESERCDLIVMGTHNHKGINRLFWGSVTDNVARQSIGNVLIIKPDQRTSSTLAAVDRDVCNIVVPYDFSMACDDAIRYAIAFTNDPDRVLAVNVAEPIETAPSIARCRLENRFRSDNRLEFERHLENRGIPKVRFRTCFSDDIASRIKSLIDDTEKSMLVVPARKLNFIERVLLGSNSERIAKQVDCPVLILRSTASSMNVADSNMSHSVSIHLNHAGR